MQTLESCPTYQMLLFQIVGTNSLNHGRGIFEENLKEEEISEWASLSHLLSSVTLKESDKWLSTLIRFARSQ